MKLSNLIRPHSHPLEHLNTGFMFVKLTNPSFLIYCMAAHLVLFGCRLDIWYGIVNYERTARHTLYVMIFTITYGTLRMPVKKIAQLPYMEVHYTNG